MSDTQACSEPVKMSTRVCSGLVNAITESVQDSNGVRSNDHETMLSIVSLLHAERAISQGPPLVIETKGPREMFNIVSILYGHTELGRS